MRKISLEELADAIEYAGAGNSVPRLTATALLNVLKQRGWAITEVPGPRDDPEPLFVLRAKDVLAGGAIVHYQGECLRHNLGEQAQQVDLAYGEHRGWQRRHPELCKLPDHTHVPVDQS